MIPSILCQQEENNAKTPNIFAYVSVQDKIELDNRSKSLRGQIRKCNLTNSRMSGKQILKEVNFDGNAMCLSS